MAVSECDSVEAQMHPELVQGRKWLTLKWRPRRPLVHRLQAGDPARLVGECRLGVEAREPAEPVLGVLVQVRRPESQGH